VPGAPSKNLEVISTPEDFYTALLDGISKAKHRIIFSSLYIGSEQKELVSI
jgi:CDP-diacylglycerol---glycerol-3-phosphate 3-phosphatidyltransferase